MRASIIGVEEEEEVEAVDEAQAEAELAIEDADERVESISLSDVDAGYEEVEPVEPATYTATAEGLAALEENWSLTRVMDVINAEPQYLSIWKQCLEMCSAEGGATKKDIAVEIDDNELLKKPRRWCQYFLGKLNDTAALKFEGTWQITDLGREALESELFAA